MNRTSLNFFIFFFALSIAPFFLFGQQSEKFLLTTRLIPEKTEYLNHYSSSKESETKSTINLGLQALLQYNLNSVIFVQGGLGYIPRKLNTRVAFDQSAIPPPRQSLTKEYVQTKHVTYRILQMPLMLGINLASAENGRFFVEAGIIGNFLMNAHYETAKRYTGTYDKSVWLGHTFQIGGGFDLPISKSLWLTFGLDFTIENTVKEDPYLYGSQHSDVALTHTYTNGFAGIKIPLKK